MAWSFRGQELHHPVVVLRAARLLHALFHARETRGTGAGDEFLRRLGGLRKRLDAALLELGALLHPQRLQRLQAGRLVLDRGALQNLAGLRRERIPLLLVYEDHEIGLEEVGQDAVLDIAVPVEVHQPDLGPGGDVYGASLERRIQLGGVQVDDLGAEVVREEGVVDRVAPDLEAADIDLAVGVELRLLGRPEAKADATIDPAEELHAHALLVDLIEELQAAILARRRAVDAARAHRI